MVQCVHCICMYVDVMVCVCQTLIKKLLYFTLLYLDILYLETIATVAATYQATVIATAELCAILSARHCK